MTFSGKGARPVDAAGVVNPAAPLLEEGRRGCVKEAPATEMTKVFKRILLKVFIGGPASAAGLVFGAIPGIGIH